MWEVNPTNEKGIPVSEILAQKGQKGIKYVVELPWKFSDNAKREVDISGTDIRFTILKHIGERILLPLKSKWSGIAVELSPPIGNFEAYIKDKTKQASEQKQEATHEVGKTPIEKVANYVKMKLENVEKFTSQELFNTANEAFGGTQAEGKYSPKDAYDAMELGINQYLLSHKKSIGPLVSEYFAKSNLEKIKTEILDKIPTQTKRTGEQEEFQQFSTPPNISYIASWVANITKDDTVLEPSAGIGGLAVFAKSAGAKTVVNELSPRRAEILKAMGFDRVFTENAEQLNNILPDDVKPTVVVMNPPFSSTAGRIKGKTNTKNAILHIEQALKRLEPNGRLVAIVGRGMSENAVSFKDWWNKIKQEYNVRANIGITGNNYMKYGTSFDVQLLVIDKTGKTEGKTIAGVVTKLEDIFPLLEGIKNDRRAIESTTSKPDKQKVPQESGSKPRPVSAIPVSTDRVGDREGSQDRGPGELEDNARPQRDSTKTDVSGKPGKVPESADTGTGAVHQPQDVAKSEDTGGSSGISSRTTEVLPGSERGTEGIKVESEKVGQKAKGELTDAVFSEYAPQKLKIKGAKQHPGKLAQSAAMAAVEPPTPTYSPKLPERLISEGKLSIAQLESIVYAGQAHEQVLPDGTRRGFFIGDGTGVGKGREISGIILDNFNQGRKKAVWVSKNNPLLNDAKRDFEDIGGDPSLIFGKPKAGAEIKQKEGILFVSYDTLGQGLEITRNGEISSKKDSKARIDQIVNWLGKDFDGIIAFDEAHGMRNSIAQKGKRGIKKPAIRALAGIELQKRLPNARVVYVSATGASEVANLAYADRLGLWGEGTPFANKNDFISKIQAGGLAAMELVARDMKAMGVYIARNLSYDGVTYSTLEHNLTSEQTEIYDTMANGWQIVLQNIGKALEETGGDKNSQAKRNAVGQFWGAQQRFFNQVLTSMQMPSVINQVREDLKNGNAVVMQLVNTNEATQNRQIARMEEGDSLEDIDLTPREILMQFLDKSFPIQQFEEYTDEDGNVRSRPVFDSDDKPVISKEALAMKEELMAKLGAMKVPEGPLEMVLNAFGAENVAEVTGRTRRIVMTKNEETGRMERVLESRTPKHAENDANDFMNDKKQILIFSDAGGTGRSYHASLTAKNQRRRIHYLIQPGWIAENAVQGFGRTHRTNQASAPHYTLVTTNLKGQKRFISSIARRLDQLGALTKGQRQTGSQGLFSAKDNLESNIARDALTKFYNDLARNKIDGLDAKETFNKMGLANMLDEYGQLLESDDLRNITKFLNRILALDSAMQNKVFDAFTDRLDRAVDIAIANGELDVGLETYRADTIKITDEKVVYTDEKSGAETKYAELETGFKNKILTFKGAKKLKGLQGFYKNTRSGRVYALTDANRIQTLEDGRVVRVWELNGQTIDNIATTHKQQFEKGNWELLKEEEAEKLWNESVSKVPEYRTKKMHLITGALLPIWDRLPTGHVRVIRENR